MTCFFLVRHAHTDVLGRVLTGRAADVRLNAYGRRQAEALCVRLHGVKLKAIYSSPLERATETAEFLARERGLTIHCLPELHELDYGEWQGCAVAELQTDPLWQEYNRCRSLYRIPGGESLAEAQLRMLRALEILHQEYPHDSLLLVSHADPIKALLAYLLGAPLDFAPRLEIASASISAVVWQSGAARVVTMNHTDAGVYLQEEQ